MCAVLMYITYVTLPTGMHAVVQAESVHNPFAAFLTVVSLRYWLMAWSLIITAVVSY